MPQVSKFLRKVGPDQGYLVGSYEHYCPGCKGAHVIATDGKNRSGAQWTFDGNVEKPTFSPSVNIRINTPDMGEHYQPDIQSSVCHYFLRVGQIQFLGDCTHDLRGQTVAIPELPLTMTDRYVGPGA